MSVTTPFNEESSSKNTNYGSKTYKNEHLQAVNHNSEQSLYSYISKEKMSVNMLGEI